MCGRSIPLPPSVASASVESSTKIEPTAPSAAAAATEGWGERDTPAARRTVGKREAAGGKRDAGSGKRTATERGGRRQNQRCKGEANDL